METEAVYQALVSDPINLKPYVKKASPYAWNDISHKAKYEALIRLSSSGSVDTQRAWDLGLSEREDTNAVARWFLFRRFRLAGTALQKRYSETHSDNMEHISLASAESAAYIRAGKSILCCDFSY